MFEKILNWKKTHRGQAAIFDGIMFLLLTSVSVALIFSFMANYGEAQSRTLRSSHSLNYGQSIMKTLYYLDAGQMKDVKFDQGYENTTGFGCDKLEPFASNSVADLIKRDIADGRLDDSFASTSAPDSGGTAPGKLAMRCAFKEMLKPVVEAGYDYYAEVLMPPTYAPFPGSEADPDPLLVTNLPSGDELYAAAGSTGSGCDTIAQRLRAKNLLAIATPFSSYNDAGERTDNQMRICFWPSERKSSS